MRSKRMARREVTPSFFSFRIYAVGQLLAGAAREQLSKTQKAYRKCVSPEFLILCLETT